MRELSPKRGACVPLSSRALDAVPLAQRNVLRDESRLPGLGHRLYPQGDPHARVLLSRPYDVDLSRQQRQCREIVEQVMHVAPARTDAKPNLDFASAAVC